MNGKGIRSRRADALFLWNGHALALTIFSWLALCISPEPYPLGAAPLAHVVYNLVLSWKPFDLTRFFLLPTFYILFSQCVDRFSTQSWRRPSIWIPSVLFSLFMVLGQSYESVDSWWIALEWRNGQILKSVFLFVGYFLLFSRAVAVFYLLIEKLRSTPLTDRLKTPSSGDGTICGASPSHELQYPAGGVPSLN